VRSQRTSLDGPARSAFPGHRQRPQPLIQGSGPTTPITRSGSPIEKLRAEIADVFAGADGHHDLGATLEDVARLGARLLLQAALEEEVTEFVSRGRYERRAGNEDARDGSRNGYSDLTVRTTAGPVTLRRPKLRGTTVPFASRLLGKGVTKTNALESW